MMKKICMMAILTLIVLGFNTSKLQAAESYVGHIKCSYSMIKGRDKISPEYIIDGGINFYHSELQFESDNKLPNSLYVTMKKDDGTIVYRNTSAQRLDLSRSLPGINSSLIWESFKKEYENNQTSCPKYFMLKESGWNHVPYFNKDLETYCGEDSGGCPVTAKLNSNSSTTIVKPLETKWTVDVTGGVESCNGAKIQVYVDSDGIIKGDISYDTSSPFYESTAKQVVTKKVDIRYATDQDIPYIYNLLKYGKFPILSFNGYNGKEEIFFGRGKYGSACYYDSEINSSVVNECQTFDELKPEMDKSKAKMDEKAKTLNNVANKYLQYNNGSYAIMAPYSTYNKNTSLDDLKKTANEIKKGIADSKNASQGIEDYLADLSKISKELCSTDSEKMESVLKKLASDTQSRYDQKLNGLNNLLKKLKDIFKELGLDDEVKEIDETLKLSSALQKSIKEISVPNMKSLLDGTLKFNFKEGCGIISSDMRKWMVQVLDIIKIAALVLTLVLGMLDFFKALVSNESDAMKKVFKSFINRLIAVVLLFLLPVLIEFILGIVDIYGVDAADPLCGLNK